jgi:hypothetical protein
MESEYSFIDSIKNYSSYIVFSIITLYFFYWIYQNIIKDDKNQNNNISNNIQSNQKELKFIKPKMSISINGLLFFHSKITNEDLPKIYETLDSLSEKYNLFLIVKLENNDEIYKIKDEILEKLETIIEDNIVYKHRILFCSTKDGLCAMIRSLDPIIHIEFDDYVIINLIRYINEFWFINSEIDKEIKVIHNKIENDTNNAKLDTKDLMNKIKFFKSTEEMLSKL